MLSTILAQLSSVVASDAEIVVLLLVVLVVSAIIAIIPCWILSSKGYDGSAMFGMFLLSIFCSWPIGLCVALIMPNKRELQARGPAARPRRAPPPMTRQQRQREAEMLAMQPPAQPAYMQHAALTGIPPGFLQCPRCGQHVNAALSACWNCKLPFHSALVVPASPGFQPVTPEYQPPQATPQQAPGPYAAPFRTTSPEPVESSMGADASVGMSGYSSAPADPDATPIMPAASPANLGATEIKVRCVACRKKFAGTVAHIAALKACPKCKATPFRSEAVTA